MVEQDIYDFLSKAYDCDLIKDKVSENDKKMRELLIQIEELTCKTEIGKRIFMDFENVLNQLLEESKKQYFEYGRLLPNANVF